MKQTQHGTVSGWVRGKCRCDECRDAYRTYCNTRYATKDPRGFGSAKQIELLNIIADGATILDAAKRVGVSKSTVALLARARPEFRRLLDQALDSGLRHQRARPTTRYHRGSPHGSLGAYAEGCRCERCKEAHDTQAERDANSLKGHEARYAERELDGDRWVHPRAEHGTANGYNNYGCRCAPCSAAQAGAARERRQRTGR
jgi:hypothetical protein